jgi:hypothetical protein
MLGTAVPLKRVIGANYLQPLTDRTSDNERPVATCRSIRCPFDVGDSRTPFRAASAAHGNSSCSSTTPCCPRVGIRLPLLLREIGRQELPGEPRYRLCHRRVRRERQRRENGAAAGSWLSTGATELAERASRP